MYVYPSKYFFMALIKIKITYVIAFIETSLNRIKTYLSKLI